MRGASPPIRPRTPTIGAIFFHTRHSFPKRRRQRRRQSFPDGDESQGSDGVAGEIDADANGGGGRPSMATVAALLLACAARLLLLALSLSGASDGTGSRGTGLSRPHANQPPDRHGRIAGERMRRRRDPRGICDSAPSSSRRQRDLAGPSPHHKSIFGGR